MDLGAAWRAPGRGVSITIAGERTGQFARCGTVRPMPDDSKPRVMLFTDGACSGNPGPGGWAYILRHPVSGKEVEGSGGEARTTNNRMELRAVIEGLSALTRPSAVEVWSDSKYVLDGLREWMEDWKKKGWRTAAKKPVKNVELWKRLDDLKGTHALTFHWVKGHEEHPENIRADALAVAARDAAAAGAGAVADGDDDF